MWTIPHTWNAVPYQSHDDSEEALSCEWGTDNGQSAEKVRVLPSMDGADNTFLEIFSHQKKKKILMETDFHAIL